MSDLSGKIALITGAGGAIGSAIARVMVRAGASVVVTDLREDGADLVRELGDKALFVRHDVTSADDWADVVAKAEGRFGTPDVLVNNAGYFAALSLADTDVDTMERALRVNVLGPFLGIKALMQPMERRGGGSIVNIASVAALRCAPGQIAYATSKWALRGVAGNAAVELAPAGIRVNSVFPGMIDTPLQALNPPERLATLAAMIPSRRMGRSEEVAEAVAFLASDAASYINGAEFSVDGGLRL